MAGAHLIDARNKKQRWYLPTLYRAYRPLYQQMTVSLIELL